MTNAFYQIPSWVPWDVVPGAMSSDEWRLSHYGVAQAAPFSNEETVSIEPENVPLTEKDFVDA